MLFLKGLHIAALVIWCAGLLYFPGLLIGHHRVADSQDFSRIRLASRFGYMAVVSPAAFVAIGAGMALLFLADALHPWMFLKLAAVGMLVVAHLQYGYVLVHLADEDAVAPTVRVRMITGLVALAIAVILWLVLAKPAIPQNSFPEWLTNPGLLDRPRSA